MDKAELCSMCLNFLGFIAAVGLIVLGLSNNNTVGVTVAEASLVAPGNGSTASVALAVAVRNPNTAMFVWRTTPLDAELRHGGRPFAHVRLAAGAGPERISPMRTKVYRVAVAAAKSALGSDAAAGVFRLELLVNGKFKYSTKTGSFNTTMRCPLKLPLSAPREPCADLTDYKFIF